MLPEWNDLPEEAREAMMRVAEEWNPKDPELAGQIALDIYNAGREACLRVRWAERFRQFRLFEDGS